MRAKTCVVFSVAFSWLFSKLGLKQQRIHIPIHIHIPGQRDTWGQQQIPARSPKKGWPGLILRAGDYQCYCYDWNLMAPTAFRAEWCMCVRGPSLPSSCCPRFPDSFHSVILAKQPELIKQPGIGLTMGWRDTWVGRLRFPEPPTSEGTLSHMQHLSFICFCFKCSHVFGICRVGRRPPGLPSSVLGPCEIPDAY